MQADLDVQKPSLRQKVVALIARLYPFYSGNGSFANLPIIQRLTGRATPLVWAKVPGGEVVAPLGDYVGRAAFFAGELDRKVAWICKQLVRPGDTVLDIGANIGMVTVLLADLVGPTGKVESFEPNPRMCALLRAAIERNSLSHVVLHPVALGPEPDSLELRIPHLNAGSASLVRTFADEDCDVVTVPVAKLSDQVTVPAGQEIRFVKIDVEGYEAQVLAGAHALFEVSRPQAVLFELNERSAKTLVDEPVVSLLTTYGYQFLSIPRNFIRMKLTAFDPSTTDEIDGHDILAIAPGDHFDDMLRKVNATNLTAMA